VMNATRLARVNRSVESPQEVCGGLPAEGQASRSRASRAGHCSSHHRTAEHEAWRSSRYRSSVVETSPSGVKGSSSRRRREGPRKCVAGRAEHPRKPVRAAAISSGRRGRPTVEAGNAGHAVISGVARSSCDRAKPAGSQRIHEAGISRIAVARATVAVDTAMAALTFDGSSNREIEWPSAASSTACALVLLAARRRADHRAPGRARQIRPAGPRSRSPIPTTCSVRSSSRRRWRRRHSADHRLCAGARFCRPGANPRAVRVRCPSPRIVLLAAREAGYRSLMRLNSRAFLETPPNEQPHLKLAWLEDETRG